MQQISQCLDEIVLRSRDEVAVQKHLEKYRTSIDRIDQELRTLGKTLISLADDLFPPTRNIDLSPIAPYAERLLVRPHLLPDILSQISIMCHRTVRCTKALTANLSIIESRRDIAEAESVTKFTELGRVQVQIVL